MVGRIRDLSPDPELSQQTNYRALPKVFEVLGIIQSENDSSVKQRPYGRETPRQLGPALE